MTTGFSNACKLEQGLQLIKWVMGLILCLHIPAQASVTVQEVDDYIPAGNWQVSLAVGGGELQSPLSDSKNIDMAVFPSVRYYRQRFYLENTSMGYNLYEAPRFAIDLAGRLNFDGIFFPGSGSHVTKKMAASGQLDVPGERPFSVLPPPNRRLSYLGGMSFHWLGPVNTGLSILGDLSSVHGGRELELIVGRSFAFRAFKIGIELGANYKSHALVDYYYGAEIKLPAMSEPMPLYQPREAVNSHLKLEGIFPLTESVQLLAAGRLDKLDSEIWRSPYVIQPETRSFFIGIQYTL